MGRLVNSGAIYRRRTSDELADLGWPDDDRLVRRHKPHAVHALPVILGDPLATVSLLVTARSTPSAKGARPAARLSSGLLISVLVLPVTSPLALGGPAPT
jgi:hypothetical protein